jgi:hypothetical protein
MDFIDGVKINEVAYPSLIFERRALINLVDVDNLLFFFSQKVPTFWRAPEREGRRRKKGTRSLSREKQGGTDELKRSTEDSNSVPQERGHNILEH